MPATALGQLTILEQTLEGLKVLPPDLHRMLLFIEELDKRCDGLNEELAESRDEVLQLLATKNPSFDEVKESLEHIRSLEQEASQLSNEKVAVSNKIFNIVQSYIARTNDDLQLLKTTLGDSKPQYDLSDSDLDDDSSISPSQSPRSRPSSRKRSFAQYIDESDEEDLESSTTPRLETDDILSSSFPREGHYPSPSSVYCFCQQPSFGEMIACDYSSCSFEWFHFKCVGLTSQPQGAWFCPECSRMQ